MSVIAIGLNLLLAVMLGAALLMGWRLNRRLKGLRDSQEGFALAVGELNAAAARAERGLAELRAASDEASDILSDRVEKARALAAKLERLVEAGGPAAAQAPAADEARAERLGALIAAAHLPRARSDEALQLRPRLAAVAPRRPLAERLERAERPERAERIDRLEPLVLSRPTRSDDDLFDDEPAPRALGGRR